MPSTLLIRKLTQAWWHLLVAFPFTRCSVILMQKKRFLYQHSLLHKSWAGRRRKNILLLLHTSHSADRYQMIWNENYVFHVHHQQISQITICHFILFFSINTFQKYHTKWNKTFWKQITKKIKYFRLYFLRYKSKHWRISNAVVWWQIKYLTGFRLSLENGRNVMWLFKTVWIRLCTFCDFSIFQAHDIDS